MMTKKDISEKTTKELIAKYISLNDSIKNTGCFSCRDLKLESWISNELYNRGYEMDEDGHVVERNLILYTE